MVHAELKLTGHTRIIKSLMRLVRDTTGDRATDLWTNVGIKLTGWVQRNIRQEGQLAGARWPRMARSTRYKGGGPKLLQSLADQVAFVATQRSVTVGFANEKLARWHHFGTRGNYPIVAHGKALSFPYPGGYSSTKTRLRSKQAESSARRERQRRGAEWARAQRPRARNVAHFLKTGGSKKDFMGLDFFVGPKVTHPGLPARPLLPTQRQAEAIMARVLEETLRRAEEEED